LQDSITVPWTERMSSGSRDGFVPLILRWMPLLILAPVLAGLAGFLVAQMIPPTYQAGVTVDTLANSGSASTQDLQVAQQLARSYVETMRARPILEEAAARANVSLPYATLADRVRVQNVRDTQLLRVTVEDTNRDAAAGLANAVVEVFNIREQQTQAQRFDASRQSLVQLIESQRADVDARTAQLDAVRAQPATPERDAQLANLTSTLAPIQATYGATLQSYQALLLNQATRAGGLTVVEPAVAPTTPIRPSRTVAVGLAAVAGLLVAILIIGAAEYLDDRVLDPRAVRAATDAAAIGAIPLERGDAKEVELARAQSFRLLTRKLVAATNDDLPRTLLITSAEPGEGKTTAVSNLGARLAETGKRVLLVDADLRKPSLMRAFNVPNQRGLSGILSGQHDDARELVQPTRTHGLDILVAGIPPSDPTALLASWRFDEQIAQLATGYDITIIDTSSLSETDPALIAGRVDAVLLVIDSVRIRGAQARKAAVTLRESGGILLGVILNNVPGGERLNKLRSVITNQEHETPVRTTETPLKRSAVSAPGPGENP
jgi:capsular exopolysaccharide synthesis family protein